LEGQGVVCEGFQDIVETARLGHPERARPICVLFNLTESLNETQRKQERDIMRRIALITAIAGCLFPLMASAPAHAQATRTWVSGVGDDVNPCSRTAPCKTFQGAISKTAAGGEINCLDPGGFGAVTITKALTISCEAGTAGVLVSGTNAIIINAGANDHVVLKGLDFDGLGTGLVGISFRAGASLVVQDCVIRNFQGNPGVGIAFDTSTNATLNVLNTVVTHNGTISGGGGIRVAPANASAKASAFLDRVTVTRNNVGIVSLGLGATASMQVTDSAITSNLSTGAIASGTGAVVRIGRSAITDNGGASISGNVLSYLDNQIQGNNPDTAPATAGGYR
jgi:hypothetical protein